MANMSNLIFISHANPEDNQVASWFATQLTLAGYNVWCDVHNLGGGDEAFWLTIQEKIKSDAAKVIYILSNASCDLRKHRGLQKELTAADNRAKNDPNFIIPLRVQKLEAEIPIYIEGSIYINADNWADGFNELLERLEKAQIAKQSVELEDVYKWWPELKAESLTLIDRPSKYISNLIKITTLPDELNFFSLERDGNIILGEHLKKFLPKHIAYIIHGDQFGTFAYSPDIASNLASDVELLPTHTFSTNLFLEGENALEIKADDAHRLVVQLLNKAMHRFLAAKGMQQLPQSPIQFLAPNLIPKNKIGRISLIGNMSVPKKRQGTWYKEPFLWHWGCTIACKSDPFWHYVVTPQIVFTKPYTTFDPQTLQYGERLILLKKLNWMNQTWINRLEAFNKWLFDNDSYLTIGRTIIEVEPELMSFELNKSYQVLLS